MVGLTMPARAELAVCVAASVSVTEGGGAATGEEMGPKGLPLPPFAQALMRALKRWLGLPPLPKAEGELGVTCPEELPLPVPLSNESFR